MKTILTLLFLILGAPTFALSCVPYNPIMGYLDAAASEEAYVVVEGTLDFNPRDLPRGGINPQGIQPEDTEFDATMTGFSLTQNGFTARFIRTIRIKALCYGPWCASLQPGRHYLAFLRKTGSGYELEINPCGGFAFSNPSGRMLDRIHACYLGQSCDPGLD